MYQQDISNEMRKPTAIRRKVTTVWSVSGTKIPQYGSMILKIKLKGSLTIQAKSYICENDTAILGLRPSIHLGLLQINCSIILKDTRKIENIEDLANAYPD